MTEARRKVKAALAGQGRTFRELAAAADLTEATVHNVLDNRAASRKSRQAISDSLGVKIWPDIEVQTAIGMIAEATVFLRLSRQQADDLHKKFPATTRVVQSGGDTLGPWMVEFLADTPAIVNLKNPTSPPEPASHTKAAKS